MTVDPLHGGDIHKRPASAAVHDVQLEPGNVVHRRAGLVADRLAGWKNWLLAIAIQWNVTCGLGVVTH